MRGGRGGEKEWVAEGVKSCREAFSERRRANHNAATQHNKTTQNTVEDIYS